MESWRALLKKGLYPYAPSAVARFGVLDEDACAKLKQPLINPHDNESAYTIDDDRPESDSDDDDHHHHQYRDCSEGNHVRMESGYGSRHGTERKSLLQRNGNDVHGAKSLLPPRYEVTDALRALVTNVLWPTTTLSVAAAASANCESRCSERADKAAARHALHTVTTLRANAKARRKSETLDDLHERALTRMAVITVAFALWLILTIYGNAGE